MKKIVAADSICICKHEKSWHTPKAWKYRMWNLSEYDKEACYHPDPTEGPWGDDLCICRKFKLDNIKYLEGLI